MELQKRIVDVAVVGAGPAGLAAAVSAKRNGAEKVLMIERDSSPCGILQQCIHPGFGLKYFNEELTGPEYGERFAKQVAELDIEVLYNTMALELNEHTIICSSSEGMIKIEAKSIILSMGCRERTRANLMIPGSRPAGIYTAGSAQRLLNMYGNLVGREIVILGSGDIGMIMARRLTLEGAHVKAVVEIMPYLAGLTRNKVQCLDDFGIPLMLSHTVVDITGVDRVSSVTIAPVNEDRSPDLTKQEVIECDTLLLSVGLIPENELTKTGGIGISGKTKGPEVDQFYQTDTPGIFSCGNVLHVNDLVDNVTEESETAGYWAAQYALGNDISGECVPVSAGSGVNYVCPQRVNKEGNTDIDLYFRVSAPANNVELRLLSGGKTLVTKKRIRVNPGEMEKLTLASDKIPELLDDITVELEVL